MTRTVTLEWIDALPRGVGWGLAVAAIVVGTVGVVYSLRRDRSPDLDVVPPPGTRDDDASSWRDG